MNLSRNTIKYIRSLKEKKFRSKFNTFVAEGDKMVSELLLSSQCEYLVGNAEFLEKHDVTKVQNVILVKDKEIGQVSFLRNPQNVLGVFHQPNYKLNIDLSRDLVLGLDGVQDPGNIGTIMRLADWYGIKDIICSQDTVDVYNPKVVQATMGAIARIRVHYLDLSKFLSGLGENEIPVYGTFLDGVNIYESELTDNGLILMGNEGNGISSKIESLVSNKLLIPNYPPASISSESLNVSIATAIICAEFRRRAMKI